jgi:hypothetical protein
MSRRDLSVKGGTSERCYRTRRGRTDKQWYTDFQLSQRGGGRIMAQLFILSYSDAVSFRDIRGHLGTIPSIVTCAN